MTYDQLNTMYWHCSAKMKIATKSGNHIRFKQLQELALRIMTAELNLMLK